MNNDKTVPLHAPAHDVLEKLIIAEAWKLKTPNLESEFNKQPGRQTVVKNGSFPERAIKVSLVDAVIAWCKCF